MSPWIYQGKPIEPEDIPPKAFGFIYLITQISTGRKYIGRKLLTSAARKTVKGKTKKIRKESDWQSYWSSSPEIKELIEAAGHDDFTREILVFTTSRGSTAYLEELSLHLVGALESDKWINGNIRTKIFSNWVKVDEAKLMRAALAKHIS
jgi:hypothetical protein